MTREVKLTVDITRLAEINDGLLNRSMENPDWVFVLVVVPTDEVSIGGRAAILANVPNNEVQHILGNAVRAMEDASEDDPVVTPDKPPSLS